VVAYDSKNDGISGSILSHIHKVPALKIYDRENCALQNGIRWGWVEKWAEGLESAQKFFVEKDLHGFEIEASLGLEGGVIANSMEEKLANGPAC
jgi:hypothetical protein